MTHARKSTQSLELNDASTTTLSRRTFLYSLGALALSACGGGESPVASAAGSRSAASAAVIAANDALARVVTGEADVSTSAAFVHPGLLHLQSDFDRMAAKVGAQTSPWYEGWQALTGNGHSNANQTLLAQSVITRTATGGSYPHLMQNIAAAYANAVYWKVTGNTTHADTAVKIMNNWSSTLTQVTGDTNADLAAGIYGYEFAIVGEIMRTYPGLSAANLAAFQSMMKNVFYPTNLDFLNRHNGTDITHYWANWDLCNIASMMAIGVLCDDHSLFDQAVNYFLYGTGNGAIRQAVYYLHPGYLGQWQETGRDQGHTTLGIALAGAICEMAWNQGVDLYGYDNNRFLAGAEYVAKSNLYEPDGTTIYTVPYLTYSNRDVTQTQLSTASQPTLRPCWALVYNHYVNRKGLAAPWTEKMALNVAPEGGPTGNTSGPFDQLGYGTLTFTRDPATPATAPSGLTAWPEAGQVALSWWGVASGTSYNVKRAAKSGGPYTTIAQNITDLLTYTDSPSAGTWYYVVSAQTSSGESANSAEVVAVTAVQLHTWLTFDETTGTVAADSSGNTHTGALIGGVTHVAGKSNNAISLDGSTGYVNLPDDLIVDVADFTIASWVNWNGGAAWQRIFDFGSGTGRYMYLSPKGGPNNRVRFAITTNGSYGEYRIDGTAALPTGQWTHIAVTLQGTTLTLYINGVAANSVANVPFAPWRVGPTAQNWIGRSQFSADPFFNGLVDDFRIYRGALSASQVEALAQGTSSV
ncbi:LamG-like jellyroll fold domain-containing protein [Paraburkholderia flava]|uniref:LamG-like jellyroll fold domain-containing protein n=1 Tax=Paraburkholderia flava TaxID=2547393 RepID=UPI001F0E7662|nr:LamG-like jellyroll fold domain-containing protein [Paraburkholderia flava]